MRSGCQKGAAQACGKEEGAREVRGADWRGQGEERRDAEMDSTEPEAWVRRGVGTSRAASLGTKEQGSRPARAAL